MNLRDYLVSRGITPKGEDGPVKEETPVFKLEQNQKKVVQVSEKWDTEEVEFYLKNNTIPDGPIQLNQCMTIIDSQAFISTHFAVSTSKNGNPGYKPYFERLKNYIEILKEANTD